MNDFVFVKIENSKEDVSHEVSGFWFCDCLPSFVKLHKTPRTETFRTFKAQNAIRNIRYLFLQISRTI